MRGRLIVLSLLLLVGSPDRSSASEERELSGKLRMEVGAPGTLDVPSRFYFYPSLQLKSYHDLTPELSLSLAGEARWQVSGPPMSPFWFLYPAKNLLDLEAEDLATSDGTGHLSLRLSRAELKWSTGPLDVTAGLFVPDWGVASFFRPTQYFFPVRRLSWEPGLPPASEALDLKCALFDDLSLETAGRLLEDGTGDWVVRLVDKNVAYTVVPSFARMGGVDLLGLELLAMFPDFKVWVEGTCRVQGPVPGETWLDRTVGILGLSTLIDGTTLVLEFLEDGTGEVLGMLSDGRREGGYFLATATRGFPGKWRSLAGVVKSSCGGPFFLLSRTGWEFEPGWEVGLQVRIKAGEDPGPLVLFPANLGLAVSYEF
jgi:hypothetical protein